MRIIRSCSVFAACPLSSSSPRITCPRRLLYTAIYHRFTDNTLIPQHTDRAAPECVSASATEARVTL
eukprot:763961-Hanusia_phi.AAC.2